MDLSSFTRHLTNEKQSKSETHALHFALEMKIENAVTIDKLIRIDYVLLVGCEKNKPLFFLYVFFMFIFMVEKKLKDKN